MNKLDKLFKQLNSPHLPEMKKKDGEISFSYGFMGMQFFFDLVPGDFLVTLRMDLHAFSLAYHHGDMSDSNMVEINKKIPGKLTLIEHHHIKDYLVYEMPLYPEVSSGQLLKIIIECDNTLKIIFKEFDKIKENK